MSIASLLLMIAACPTSTREGPQPGMPFVERGVPKPTASMADFALLTPERALAELREVGQRVYTEGSAGSVACAFCHGSDGAGVGAANPPLRGEGALKGDCQTQARTLWRGMTGPLAVAGRTYDGVMPASPGLTEVEVAAVLTWARTSWDNTLGPCLPADVASAR